jgi:hypothetical protein
MIENVTPTKNYEQYSTIVERIFPWTQSNATNKVFNNQKINEPIKEQAMDKNPIQPTNKVFNNQKVNEPIKEQAMDKNPTKPTMDQKTSMPNTIQLGPSTKPVDQKDTSVFEKWNVIESVGIKRQMLDKVFTTDEAVSELYTLIVNRIHYDREQEMISRLRAHVERLNQRNQLKKSQDMEATC